MCILNFHTRKNTSCNCHSTLFLILDKFQDQPFAWLYANETCPLHEIIIIDMEIKSEAQLTVLDWGDRSLWINMKGVKWWGWTLRIVLFCYIITCVRLRLTRIRAYHYDKRDTSADMLRKCQIETKAWFYLMCAAAKWKISWPVSRLAYLVR